MSKTIAMLNGVENKRMNKYSMALLKTVAQKSVEEPTHSQHEWRIKAVLIVIIMALLWINFKFSATIKEYIAERKDSLAKLTSIERIAQESSQRMKAVDDNLNSLSLKLQTTDKQIANLAQQSEAQTFAIDNLKKAKDTLFNKVSDLEVKLEANNAQEATQQGATQQ